MKIKKGRSLIAKTPAHAILLLHCLFLRGSFQCFLLLTDALVQIRYAHPDLLLDSADHFFLLIDARLKLFENRIAALLYKQAVEMDMSMSILLQSLNVSEEVLRQERAKSIAAVKRTNGQLRMEQKLRELESEAWQG